MRLQFLSDRGLLYRRHMIDPPGLTVGLLCCF
jgi:hypothetical protein